MPASRIELVMCSARALRTGIAVTAAATIAVAATAAPTTTIAVNATITVAAIITAAATTLCDTEGAPCVVHVDGRS